MGAPRPARGAVPRVTEEEATYRLSWAKQTPPFASGLAISRGGSVAAVATDGVTLLAGQSGKSQLYRAGCAAVTGGFAFVNAELAVLVCGHEVELLGARDLASRAKHQLPREARLASVAGGSVAIAFVDGRVRIYRIDPWELIHDVVPQGEPTALALAASGSAVALAGEGGALSLHDIASGKSTLLFERGGLTPTALAFSQRGDKLFAGIGPAVAVWDAKTARRERRFTSASDVELAVWLGSRAIVSAGPEGMVVLDHPSGVAHGVGGGWDGTPRRLVAVAVSPAGDLLCSVSRDGFVACHARGGSAPGRLPIEVAGVVDSGGNTTFGRLNAFRGLELEVAPLSDEPLPPKGAVAVVMLYPVTPRAGDTRWLRIGEGKVDKVGEELVTLRIDPALSAPNAASLLEHNAATWLSWLPPD
jgi:hypothetical protein